MLNRRHILQQALMAATAVVLGKTRAIDLVAQQGAATHSVPLDDMTLDTLQQGQHYPPPNFGPVPVVLPPETAALAGSASFKSNASKHGVVAGAAVIVHALASDPVLA